MIVAANEATIFINPRTKPAITHTKSIIPAKINNPFIYSPISPDELPEVLLHLSPCIYSDLSFGKSL